MIIIACNTLNLFVLTFDVVFIYVNFYDVKFGSLLMYVLNNISKELQDSRFSDNIKMTEVIEVTDFGLKPDFEVKMQNPFKK